VKSSNQVVRHASAPLIARMDADDISMPHRLEHQWQAFQSNPNAGIVGQKGVEA
jgi:cellulose synthase/poly-beta-1,6-N-acetylglucosamine synthase-like glycosyltransferase